MPSTERSPVQTRSWTPPTQQPTTEAQTLQVVLEELRRQREERLQFEETIEARLEARDEMLLQRMEQRLTQLSPSINIPVSAGGDERAHVSANAGEGRGEDVFVDASEAACGNISLKLKPDNYDGAVPLREFLVQFTLIARANGWNEVSKATALASCLRGKARAVLESLESTDAFTFKELKEKLELRFGEGVFAQDYYLRFTNRRQGSGEDPSELGADLERLARLAYPECSAEARDKIACSQFVAALSDGFIKRALQMEGITSLRKAIERAKTVKIINENSFPTKRERSSVGDYNRRQEKKEDQKYGEPKAKGEGARGGKRDESRGVKTGECWKCGATGHFRAECPTVARGN